MPTDVMLTGRLVGGHPMVANARKDDSGAVLRQQDGVTPRTSTFIAVAVPKTPGVTDWRMESWGQTFQKEAQEGWNLGEWQHPTFAWKVTDGDSTIPKKPFGGKPGRIPAQCEGYPGHWVVSCSTELGIKCYHLGKYGPMDQIQNKDEIKAGDYCRVLVSVKGNKPSKSPGLYVNPTLFELSRAGQRIVLDGGPDAAEAFGGSAPVLPANGAFDTSVSPPPVNAAPPPPVVEEPRYLVNGVEYTVAQLRAARWTEAQIAAATPVAPAPSGPVAPAPGGPVAPAPDFLNPPELAFLYQGKTYTKSQLLGYGWTEAQIASLPPSTGIDVPFNQ